MGKLTNFKLTSQSKKLESFNLVARIQRFKTSTVRRKYAYHFQRLQMAIFSRLLMVGLFPPCCTSRVIAQDLLEKKVSIPLPGIIDLKGSV